MVISVIKKYVKCIIPLILIANIITFAAVVSDNDGSAFITKSEYDSLKNNFQSQLDSYNTSIDAKIDNAVASYLAGIKAEKVTKLTNIYEDLGGKDIKFGKPNISPTIKPVSGWGLYYLNCWQSGYIAAYPGAGYNAIKDASSSSWWSSSAGGGTLGQFLVYDNIDGDKYLTKYIKGLLEAVYVGGWYRVVEHVNSIQAYPWGSAPTKLGESCVVGDKTLVDCCLSYYRAYENTKIDLTNWTSSYGVGTGNIQTIKQDDYDLPNQYRTARADFTVNRTATINADTRGGTCNGSIKFTNLRVYDWTINSTDKYSNLIPGFYEHKKWWSTLYGGVQFFQTKNEDGKVNITKLRLTRAENTGGTWSTSGDVYFAINAGMFPNNDELDGTERFTKVTGATLYDESKNLYKADANAEISIEFEGKKNTVYFIKLQPNVAVTTKTDLYCGISNGAEITITSIS